MRALRNDFTVAHNRKLYQIEKALGAKKVLVQERVNGEMLITHNDIRLPFKEITVRPEKQQKPTTIHKHRKGHSPSVDHPWNKWNSRLFKPMRNQATKPVAATT